MRTMARAALFALGGLCLVTSLAAGQAPDWERDHAPPPPRYDVGAPARERVVVQQPEVVRLLPLGISVVRGANLATRLTEKGAEILITFPQGADVPHLIILRTVVRHSALGWVAAVAQQGEGRRLPLSSGMERYGLLGLLWMEGVELTTEELPNGVLVNLYSDTPEATKKIQEALPWLVSVSMDSADFSWLKQQGVPILKWLASEAIRMQVQEQAQGVVLRIGSDDPQTAQRIKVDLPQYVKWLKHWNTIVEVSTPTGETVRRLALQEKSAGQ